MTGHASGSRINGIRRPTEAAIEAQYIDRPSRAMADACSSCTGTAADCDCGGCETLAAEIEDRRRCDRPRPPMTAAALARRALDAIEADERHGLTIAIAALTAIAGDL